MAERQPLILLPGLLCDQSLWAPQMAALADLADPIVGDLTQAQSMAAMAEAVLASAPPRFALAGLSMGGYVSFEIMRRAPERVIRLALLDTSARPDTEAQTQQRRAFIGMCEHGEFKGVTPKLLPLWIHPSRLDDEALSGTIMAMTARVGRDAFIRQQTAIMNRPDSRPDLVNIACPTLVLCGHEDLPTPVAVHREMATDIPNSRLVLVPECGHLSTLERPEEVSAAMRRWLADED